MSNRALQNFAHGPGGVKTDPDNDATAAAANEAKDNEVAKLKEEIETLAKKNEGELSQLVIFCYFWRSKEKELTLLHTY